jgi:hypothetical protein
MLFYRVLFWLAIAPSLAFMMLAAIADALAWELDAGLDALENKGWPE